MQTVKVTKGKHTWFIEDETGTITMETDWTALAREIDQAISEYTKPSRRNRRQGKTIKKEKPGGRQQRERR